MLRRIGQTTVSYAPEGGAGGGSTETLESVKAENAKLAARLAELEKPKPKPEPKEDDPEDDDLAAKARKSREHDDKKKGDTKALESALKFNMSSTEFLKQNESLLGSEIKDLFTQAEKENFDSALDKESAIKSGLVQSFFKVKAHVDLLTPALKRKLDDFQALTKNGKQEKANEMYDSVFEPAFEMLKQIKKAEALNKSGASAGNEDAYTKRLIESAKKRHMGVKNES